MTNEERFTNLLLVQATIDGIEPQMRDLITYIKERGFFKDPASARYHGNYEGGLVEHSLNVYDELVKLMGGVPTRSIIYTALLHDLCKVGTYAIDYRNTKDDRGVWIKVPYYTHKEDNMPYGHGEKSVLIISQFFKLSFEEMLAIRWHMGAYESKESWPDLERAQLLYPLVCYIHFADILATRREKQV